ncbi:unnamed protein product [Ilex paraguariensis]|uniref:XS domain-containing protein n=1 Tax=Ilex paraguariensis TaxID=185542 RepID=A0ABC8SDF0_9AQUA
MRERRYGGEREDVRTKTQEREYSPARPRSHSRPRHELERRDYYDRYFESESFRRTGQGSGSRERRDYDRRLDEGDRDGGFRRRDYGTHFKGGGTDGLLLRFCEDGLSGPRDSTSRKFQWKHSMEETTKSSGDADYHSLKYLANDYAVGSATRVRAEKYYIDRRISPEKEYSAATRDSTERSYQGRGYPSMAQSRILLERPISVETEEPRTYSSYPLDVDVVKSSGCMGDSCLLPSRSLNVGLDLRKDEDLGFRECLHLGKLVSDKPSARKLCKEEEDSMTYLKGDTDYMISSSRSKAFVPGSSSPAKENLFVSFRETSHVLSGGYKLSSGMISRHVGDNGYAQKSHIRSPVDPAVQLSDKRNYPRPYLSSLKGAHGDYTYSEVRTGEKGDMSMMCGDFHGKMVKVEEEYGNRDLFKASIVNPSLDRIRSREHLSESRLLDHHLFSQQQPILDCDDVSGPLHKRKQDEEVLSTRNTHLEYESEVYQDHGSLLLGEVHHYETDDGPWSHEEKLKVLPSAEFDPYLEGFDGSSQHRSSAGELGFQVSEKMLKRKYAMDTNTKQNFESYRKNALMIHDQGNGEDFFLSKKSSVSHSQYRKTGRTYNEMATQMISNHGNLSVSMPRLLRKSHKSIGRDIKKRLGPVPPKVHVTHPLVKKTKQSVKKRLGPAPLKVHRPLPWLNNFEPYKLPRIQDGSDGNLHDQGGDPSEGNATPAKTEPPENSEDFKHMVHSAFFKFVKQLHDNIGQRRRLMEQGKAGSLRCSICGSDSKEFVDTQSLVRHAFMSPKVGFRSQHLGFHKALCALMGWKSAAAPNNPWVCEILSDAETLAVKEDLIIWPPVVIIHNSSIGNYKPDDRVVVSIEVLEAILKGCSLLDTALAIG